MLIVAVRQNHNQGVKGVNEAKSENQEHCEDKLEKVIMVSAAHTIVDPRAVVIESFHALLADGTVPRTRSSNGQAVRAQLR